MNTLVATSVNIVANLSALLTLLADNNNSTNNELMKCTHLFQLVSRRIN